MPLLSFCSAKLNKPNSQSLIRQAVLFNPACMYAQTHSKWVCAHISTHRQSLTHTCFLSIERRAALLRWRYSDDKLHCASNTLVPLGIWGTLHWQPGVDLPPTSYGSLASLLHQLPEWLYTGRKQEQLPKEKLASFQSLDSLHSFPRGPSLSALDEASSSIAIQAPDGLRAFNELFFQKSLKESFICQEKVQKVSNRPCSYPLNGTPLAINESISVQAKTLGRHQKHYLQMLKVIQKYQKSNFISIRYLVHYSFLRFMRKLNSTGQGPKEIQCSLSNR